MTARQQWSVVLAIVVLLGAGLAAATHLLGDELFPVRVGSAMPTFTAVSVDGKNTTRRLADYQGRVLLVNVWATWCEPCRVEMPSIEKLYQEFGPRGLAVVAISVDDAGAGDQIRAFVKETGITFEVLHGRESEIKPGFQLTGYPETFIVARDGTIRKKIIGAADWSSEANRALVRQLLGVATASP